jgi:hypothetical protein
MSLACVLLAGSGCLAGVPAALADPLIPLTPAELAFLDHARRVFPGSGDPDAFNSDGELLDQGQAVCRLRADPGNAGYQATDVSSIVAQLAVIYLCPQ